MMFSDLQAMSPDEPDEFDAERRFGGIARLYGQVGLARFRAAHVCVIGVGGVGSWAVEALARSAIGRLTLIDLDHVAESNINRQIQALSNTLGQSKVGALVERIAQINPDCHVTAIEDFITPENLAEMMALPCAYDYVIDAIDDANAKIALIAYCHQHAIPLITIGSAGGKTDPAKIEIRDLARTEQEPLLAKVRKHLRAHHGFPRGSKSKFGIDAVFSMEALTLPGSNEACVINPEGIEEKKEERVEERTGISGLNCAGFGSSIVVTASFGMLAAAHVLRLLAVKVQPN